MANENVVTVYELQSLIERCLEEVERAGYIKSSSVLETDVNGPGLTERKILVNQEEIVKHIANTIYGELYELEMIRRMAPIFREFYRLAEDFKMIDERDQKRVNLAGLRIGEK